MSEDREHDEDGYTGEAVLVFDQREVPVEVELRGYFQPIDGRYHWYGRVAANDQVTELVAAGARSAELRTPTGSATGALTDQDPWQRYRVAGTSTPPFVIRPAPEPAERF
ncbi:hypothetical protein FHS29_002719 [Saccharothrix tamanrassetensis]|uniref:DUF4873 domain-containing protein n=1 Tax=Saccharothrix tamanrassetensis TaxID=1051531 RepID=A0A841CGK9_9PSEU|nr:DUF4873 domain-containing protein [Saccharothrix tamanrassetensis]MBB5956133.1 hypothetical protein [Saccharothrix tamanrassetensis]